MANPLLYARHLYIGGTEVSDIVIPDTVTSINNEAFMTCSSITTLTIPISVTSIGYCAFCDCNNLDTVVCLNPEPATLGVDAFGNISSTNHLIVPCGSGEAYRNSDWSDYFSNITEDCGGTQGIDELNATEAEILATEYYDLMGRRLAGEPERGLFLLRTVTTNGVSTRKIVKQ